MQKHPVEIFQYGRKIEIMFDALSGTFYCLTDLMAAVTASY